MSSSSPREAMPIAIQDRRVMGMLSLEHSDTPSLHSDLRFHHFSLERHGFMLSQVLLSKMRGLVLLSDLFSSRTSGYHDLLPS